uniref:Uncharacterized protein n=1 Tax=Arundo donax TaxID=35708 RepID=A0A0A9TR35_ARUDO
MWQPGMVAFTMLQPAQFLGSRTAHISCNYILSSRTYTVHRSLSFMSSYVSIEVGFGASSASQLCCFLDT